MESPPSFASSHSALSSSDLPQSILMSPQEAYRWHATNQADFLDARSLSVFYLAGHIPRAQHSPWFRFTGHKKSGLLVEKEELQARVRALGLMPTRPIIVYGDWNKGWGEEARIWWMLEYLGHPHVYLLEGGWSAWRAHKGTRSFGLESTSVQSTWTITPNSHLRITLKQVRHFVQHQNPPQWIDVRRIEEFKGKTPYGSEYGGHLPRAHHLHWASFFDPKGRLVPVNQMRSILTNAGVHLKGPIVTYCTGGVRSAWVYMILRLLNYPTVSNYDGSWWEWSSQVSLNQYQKLSHDLQYSP